MQSYDTSTGQPLPPGQTLGDILLSRTVRKSDLAYDWGVLKFQADINPKYKRAQMRYIGLGAAGATQDSKSLAPEHFTFSTMLLPARNEFPPHLHTDVEEVFYLTQGRARFVIEHDGSKAETVLEVGDLISVPPGVYRAIVSESDEDSHFVVVIGSASPVRPTYPPGHELYGKR
jgi:mannose-6-phosphate isomerase-like protein (cupin superfamily)